MITPTVALTRIMTKDCQTDSGDRNKVSQFIRSTYPYKHDKRKDNN